MRSFYVLIIFLPYKGGGHISFRIVLRLQVLHGFIMVKKPLAICTNMTIQNIPSLIHVQHSNIEMHCFKKNSKVLLHDIYSYVNDISIRKCSIPSTSVYMSIVCFWIAWHALFSVNFARNATKQPDGLNPVPPGPPQLHRWQFDVFI